MSQIPLHKGENRNSKKFAAVVPLSLHYTVFGREELGEREVEVREIEEKLVISLVWKPKK